MIHFEGIRGFFFIYLHYYYIIIIIIIIIILIYFPLHNNNNNIYRDITLSELIEQLLDYEIYINITLGL